ncbi:MAG: TIR domain-containing protein, partial [Promethearchaeota archaeon]
MPKCFVISPIRVDKYDQVFNQIIKPAMENCGIETFCETKLTNKVFDLIPTYDLCIIIHSKDHPLIYYQTAIAKCAGKPLIFLKAKGESLPFHLNNEHNVNYDLKDLTQLNVEDVINDIINRVKEIELNDWEALQPFNFEKIQKIKDSIQKDNSKKCYIIQPIGREGSDTWEHIDSVFNYIIKPGLKKFDLKPYTIMDLKSKVTSFEPGLLSERKLRLLSENSLEILSEQVYKAILTMDLCIAILTYPDPNVFFELGMAHFESRPVIKLMDKETYRNYPFVLRKKKDLILYTYQYLSLKSVFYDKTYTSQILDYIKDLEVADWRVQNFRFKDIVIENEFNKYIKKKISQTHREIKFDNLAAKTGLEPQKIEELIEKLILRGELDAEIIKNKIIFKPSEAASIEVASTIPPGKKILIFISYATKDADWFKVQEIARSLTTYHEIEKVFYWQEDMKDNIYEYMDEYLGKCDLMLLFCSPNALKSKPIMKEWTAADSMEIPIIPVFFSSEHIPPLLKSRLGVKF